MRFRASEGGRWRFRRMTRYLSAVCGGPWRVTSRVATSLLMCCAEERRSMTGMSEGRGHRGGSVACCEIGMRGGVLLFIEGFE